MESIPVRLNLPRLPKGLIIHKSRGKNRMKGLDCAGKRCDRFATSFSGRSCERKRVASEPLARARSYVWLRLPWILVMIVTTTLTARADVRLSVAFGDNMVLQQKSQAALWGWARPGEQVTVSFAGNTATADADKDGKWKLEIKTPAAGGPYELKVAGDNTITLKNVLVGEVWLAAGQSNMEFT